MGSFSPTWSVMSSNFGILYTGPLPLLAYNSRDPGIYFAMVVAGFSQYTLQGNFGVAWWLQG